MQTDGSTPSSQAVQLDKLLSFTITREFVGVSRSKIYELLKEGKFPQPTKVGRTNYFSEREIQSWIQARLQNRSEGVAP